MPTALITGITGQDGFYLAKFLLEKNYNVHGTLRRSSTFNTSRIDGLISEYRDKNKLTLHYSDLLDSSSLNNLINLIEPDEVYNLAAQSHVAVSFENPIYTTEVGNLGSISLLEAIKHSNKKIKFYQASSSEMFGGGSKQKLNEDSFFEPKSPYAASKVFAHNITKLYRESYDLFCANGILFNHESPFRGETFVTRKITRAVGRIHLGIQNKLTLGNLEASRDWGFAGDYIKAMWMMLQHNKSDDWVVATGETYTVKQFAEAAFKYVDLDYEKYIQSSQKYFRPNEVDYLLGDPSKIKKELGWKNETSFDDLVKMMVDSDINLAKKEKVLLDENLIKPTWEYPV
tara:strand:+ start:3925 stop:4956 length:1032 start_codon:yes stop_codon:yes gene_type:complete